MIDDKTIKSLYDDKPTLLEWLKRVEAQLEELKKVTNFDTLTANNVEVTEDVNANNLEAKNAIVTNTLTAEDATIKRVNGTTANFTDAIFGGDVEVNGGDFLVDGSLTSKAIYVHQITWKYFNVNITKKYLSTKPTPYSSMTDIFSNKNDTNLSTSELIEYTNDSAILKFDSTGRVLSAVAIVVGSDGNVSTFAMTADVFNSGFVKDEVISGWGA